VPLDQSADGRGGARAERSTSIEHAAECATGRERDRGRVEWGEHGGHG